MRPERAQATVEFVGTIPVLLLAATCCLQALLLAIALLFAQVSADRAARDAPMAQATASIPAPWRRRVRIERSKDSVTVTVRAPAVLPGAGRWLDVAATSEVAQ